VFTHVTVILPVIYGWNLFLTLRKEHRLRMFENRVLRRIFRFDREEVTGGWGKPQLPDLY
jgi:hypothetical protein